MATDIRGGSTTEIFQLFAAGVSKLAEIHHTMVHEVDSLAILDHQSSKIGESLNALINPIKEWRGSLLKALDKFNGEVAIAPSNSKLQLSAKAADFTQKTREIEPKLIGLTNNADKIVQQYELIVKKIKEIRLNIHTSIMTPDLYKAVNMQDALEVKLTELTSLRNSFEAMSKPVVNQCEDLYDTIRRDISSSATRESLIAPTSRDDHRYTS